MPRASWRMGNAPCCGTRHRSSESRGLRNPRTSAHIPGTASGPHNSVGFLRYRQGTVGEGLFNDTETVKAGVSSPSENSKKVASSRCRAFWNNCCRCGGDITVTDFPPLSGCRRKEAPDITPCMTQTDSPSDTLSSRTCLIS